ncbi:sigma-70 family RNA polymerase sigma factor [Streptomyces arenae]|uniref:sigma-70 family RNA polymerase sigma factor n=1 Tax=Streptomyces arenae TaxID=29301 RepID=UPI003D29F017
MSSQANAKIARSTEPELIRRARQGDRDAFGTLYNENHDVVFRFIYYRVGGSRVLAEDLTSETFLRAMRRIDTFTWQGRDFGAWLVTIARNLVADHFKASRTRREVPTGDMLDGSEADSTEDIVLRGVDAAQAAEAVSAAMAALTMAQQQCIRLRYLEHLSLEDVAARMGKRPQAIKTLTFRGMRSMQRQLRADGVMAA